MRAPFAFKLNPSPNECELAVLRLAPSFLGVALAHRLKNQLKLYSSAVGRLKVRQRKRPSPSPASFHYSLNRESYHHYQPQMCPFHQIKIQLEGCCMALPGVSSNDMICPGPIQLFGNHTKWSSEQKNFHKTEPIHVQRDPFFFSWFSSAVGLDLKVRPAERAAS